MLSVGSEDAHFQHSIRFITPPEHCAVVFRRLSTNDGSFEHRKLPFTAHNRDHKFSLDLITFRQTIFFKSTKLFFYLFACV